MLNNVLAEVRSEVRWFFGQTLVWIWGLDLHDAAHLSGIKQLPCYGIRFRSWALYVIRLQAPK